jgi:Flp pilus assembly protein TadD
VRDVVRHEALPAVPDDVELERLIMVDRAADKVAAILRRARSTDSTFVLFPQGTMALYAFRFTRQNNLPFAVRLLELNAEAYPRSWGAADALGNGYRDSGDTTRAVAAYTRAIELLGQIPTATDANAAGEVAKARQGVEDKLAKLRPR